MNSLQPKPWKEPERAYPPKYSQYFHEQTDKLNSLAHSSPKVAEFYLKPLQEHKSQFSSFPVNTESTEATCRKIHSRERIHRRQYERQLLQVKSSQCIPAFKIREDVIPTFATFKDPARKSICNKIMGFDNYVELPPDRLKLVVNDRILKMDEQAMEYISKKLQQEAEEERIINDWHEKNRKKIILKMKRLQKRNLEHEKKNGLIKVKVDKRQLSANPSSARIDALAASKTAKKGYPQDYLDSYGLLGAGVLKDDKCMHPKSARRTTYKKPEAFPVHEDSFDPELSKEPISQNCYTEPDPYTPKYIADSMRELNEFHNRNGLIKGRVGFPQIDLEKYKISQSQRSEKRQLSQIPRYEKIQNL